ncbi:MAG: hypothetical protein ABFS28_09325 [Bacteroidota bacterium]
MWKKVIVGIVILIVVGIVAGIYLYQKPPKDYTKEKAVFFLNAESLVTSFNNNEIAANEKYLGEMIEVRGSVVNIKMETDNSVFMTLHDPFDGITCTYEKKEQLPEWITSQKVRPGDMVTIKGRCDGKLDDVRLTHCALVSVE